MDRTMTIEDAKAKVESFCASRDWDRYHGPKDLAIGVVTEASELLDVFRFKNDEESMRLLSDESKRESIGDELADVLFFVLRFSQRFGFDLSVELERKLRKNDANYPVEKAKGSNLKHDEL